MIGLPNTPVHARNLREVQVELTEMCDADCPFCINRASFAKHGRHSNGLSTDIMEKVLQWIASSGVARVRFTGGEPLLRKDLGQLVSVAKEIGLITGVNTNGSLVHHWRDVLLEMFDFVLLSIISANPARTDEIMRHEGFHRKKLQALATLSNHSNLWVSTVLSHESVGELDDIGRLLADNGVAHWILLRPEANGSPSDDYNFGGEELGRFLNAARAVEERYGLNMALGNSIPICAGQTVADRAFLARLLRAGDGGLVSEGRSKLVIDPAGRVLSHYGIPVPLGTIFDDLETMWQKPFAQSLRSTDILPSVCGACAVLEPCYGGSRIAAQTVSGTFEGEDPMMNRRGLI
jgi:radical SAM protein with 4Fe4S-binding SPASM domain